MGSSAHVITWGNPVARSLLLLPATCVCCLSCFQFSAFALLLCSLSSLSPCFLLISSMLLVRMQALRPGVQNSQDGSFRATFEDKPLMSDIVFLRAWIAVDLPKFYNPVTNLLSPAVRPPPRELKPGHMAAEVSCPSPRQSLMATLSTFMIVMYLACNLHALLVTPARSQTSLAWGPCPFTRCR